VAYPQAQDVLKHYRELGIESEINNATPHRLIQLLFDGALSRLVMAQAAIERGDVAAKGALIGKAISIVGGLRDSLDMDAGGKIAENLDNLYEYMNLRLLDASINNQADKINEVIQLLKTIKSAWDEITPST
jgi:flagellar secretion chaperone FliS